MKLRHKKNIKNRKTKRCSKCKKNKILDEFYNKKSALSGKSSQCKKCCDKYSKSHYYKNNKKEKLSVLGKYLYELLNKEFKIDYNKKYRSKNLKNILEYNRKYQNVNKKTINKQKSEKRKNNPRIFRERERKKYAKNRKRVREYQKKYHEKNKKRINERRREIRYSKIEEVRAYKRKHRDDNRDKYKKYQKNYKHKKYYSDENYRLKMIIKSRIRTAIKTCNGTKNNTTLELLGCSIKFIKNHLQSKFKKGMSWKNYGNGKYKWNLDHVIPCAYFDLTKQKEQEKCFHWSNLQPLWQEDNIKKGSVYNGKRHYYKSKVNYINC